jgi:hypothetical protein
MLINTIDFGKPRGQMDVFKAEHFRIGTVAFGLHGCGGWNVRDVGFL